MKKYLFISIILFLLSCKKNTTVETYVYTYKSQIVLQSINSSVSNLKVYLVKSKSNEFQFYGGFFSNIDTNVVEQFDKSKIVILDSCMSDIYGNIKFTYTTNEKKNIFTSPYFLFEQDSVIRLKDRFNPSDDIENKFVYIDFANYLKVNIAHTSSISALDTCIQNFTFSDNINTSIYNSYTKSKGQIGNKHSTIYVKYPQNLTDKVDIKFTKTNNGIIKNDSLFSTLLNIDTNEVTLVY